MTETEVNAQARGSLPEAFNGCTCSCHRTPGIIHFVACCGPGKPSLLMDREWFEKRVALEGGTDPTTGVPPKAATP